jgi:hypothetical protein
LWIKPGAVLRAAKETSFVLVTVAKGGLTAERLPALLSAFVKAGHISRILVRSCIRETRVILDTGFAEACALTDISKIGHTINMA